MEAFLIQSLALRALIGAGLGLIAGSFVAAVSMRWPRGRSVMRGRSACDHCAAPLGPFELIPLVSWVIQRGRCRRCGARIDPRHPAIELAAALLGAVALAAHPGPLGPVSALLGWWLLLIAILDLEHLWLPDRLTLPLIPFGLAAAWAGFGAPLPERAAGAAIGWAALFLIAWLYRRLGRSLAAAGDPDRGWAGRHGPGARYATARRACAGDDPAAARDTHGARRMAGLACYRIHLDHSASVQNPLIIKGA